MDLPEAIRLGCTMSKPNKTTLQEFRYGEIYACALGAAALAVGIHCYDVDDDETDAYDALFAMWPELNSELERSGLELIDRIAHKNDGLSWTRERIADWVEEQLRARG